MKVKASMIEEKVSQAWVTTICEVSGEGRRSQLPPFA